MTREEGDWRDDATKRIDAFIIKATPKMFEWIGWIAALGAIQYVHAKTHSWAMMVLLILGYIVLILYTHSVISQWIRVPFIKTKHNRELISGLIALFLSWLAHYIAQQAISAFSQGAV